MRNFKKFLALFLSSLMLFACTKDAIDLANTPTAATARNGGAPGRGPMATVELPYYSSASAYFDGDFGDKPKDIFGSTVASAMRSAIDQESLNIEAVGLPAYIQQLVTDGDLTVASGDLGNFLHNVSQDSLNLDLNLLEGKLINDYGQSIPYINGDTSSVDYFYIYLYMVALDLVEKYKSGDVATPRGACSFGEALKTILKEMFSGAKTGKEIGDIISVIGDNTDGELGAVFTVVGGSVKLTGLVYGAIVGAIVGIFKSIFKKEECDCNNADDIGVIFDDDCDLSETLLVTGTGKDATGWEWIVTQTPTSAFFVTTVPRLRVTQNDPAVPMLVTARPICEDAADYIDSKEIDLTSKFSNVSSPTLTGFDRSTTPGSTQFESRIGNRSQFNATANAGGAPITYSWQVIPADAAEIVMENDNELIVKWTRSGSFRVVVTAESDCGISSRSTGLDVLVNP